MLVSRTIPNLFAGVSQQASPLRHPTQAEMIDNCITSVASGTRKRPPTKHKAKLKNVTATDAYVHVINKDATHRFVVIITNASIEVFDATTGAAHTVTYPDTGSPPALLTSTTPRDDFVVVTAVDYTFIANKNRVVALTVSTAAGAITGTKQKFSDLPAAPTVGDIYLIQGDPTNAFSNYYVKWNGSVWVETLKPGVKYQLDPVTMPYKLIQTGPTTWTFGKVTWTDRLVGDDTSNPQPSFVGRAIRDIYYFRGRLGFVADENVILSRSTDPFCFWGQSVTAVLDTDPIDRSVSHTKVSILNYATPFNKELILFSDLTQFQLSVNGTLTPKTPSVDPITEYESTKICRPVGAGSSLFFAVKRDGSTGVREYFVDRETFSNDARDITEHVPTYIPTNCFKIASSTAEDMLIVLSLVDRSKNWVYKYLFKDNEKQQSAWSRFVFDAADTVLGSEFIGNTAYYVIQRADGVYLESMELQSNNTDGNLGFLVHLDRRVELVGVYDAVNDWTTWALPYTESATMTCVLGDAFGVNAGISLNITRPDSSRVRASGKWDVGACYIGRNYTMRYRFSTIYLRELNDEKVAITSGILKLKKILVNFVNSGYFRAEVTPRGRSMYSYEYTGQTVGGVVIGQTSIASGSFRFPVKCQNTDATIDIVSDSYLPCVLASAEWEGEFTIKTQRRF